MELKEQFNNQKERQVWDNFSKCLERTIEAVLDCKKSAVEAVLLAEEAQRLAKEAII